VLSFEQPFELVGLEVEILTEGIQAGAGTARKPILVIRDNSEQL